MIKRTIEIRGRLDGASFKGIDTSSVELTKPDWPNEVLLPDLAPGQKVYVRVSFEREFDDSPGRRLFLGLCEQGLCSRDFIELGWGGLDADQRAGFEKAALALKERA